MARFANPADKLSRIAAEPRSHLDQSISIVELHRRCKEQLSEHLVIGPEDRIILEGMLNDSFAEVGEHRKVSFCR